MRKTDDYNDDSSLLLGFNNRDEPSFGSIYNLFYTELIYFTQQLYRNTNISASDVVQDIFMKIWKKKSIKFKSIISIKAYIVISIKNGYMDYISHNKCVDRYNKEFIHDSYNFTSYIVESETLSLIADVIRILPAETAKVFKLFIDGWNAKEIAEKLDKTQSTVYNQKLDAIKILKKKQIL